MDSCIFVLYFEHESQTLLFILLLISFHLWSSWVLSGWVLCPFDMHPFFCFLSTSILAGTTRCSRPTLNFLASALQSAISPKNFASFVGELYLELRIWVLSVLIATGCHCFQLSQQTELGNICMYTNPCIYMSVIVSISIHLYLMSVNLIRWIFSLWGKKKTFKGKKANCKVNYLGKSLEILAIQFDHAVKDTK